MILRDRVSRWIAEQMLRHPRLRVHLADELKTNHFDSLNLNCVLSSGISIPICFEDSLISLRELFIEGEYNWLKQLPPPKRWLDLGCNNGYFSLAMLLNNSSEDRASCEALLVDGDPRYAKSITAVTSQFNPPPHFQFIHGVVGPTESNTLFTVEKGMESKIGESCSNNTMSVAVLSQLAITENLPPPYDVIKIDIEGAEVDFLENYKEVIRHTNTLIVEWHSWNNREINKEDFRQSLVDLGFTSVQALAGHTFEKDTRAASCQTFFCQRTA